MATLAGCGASEGEGPGVTLRLVAADYGDSKANSSQKYWDAVVKAYEKKTPGVKIDVSVYSWNDVDRRIKEMVAADEAPDLAQAGTYADYASAGRLYEVDDLLSIPVQAGFLPQLADAGKVKRVAYGMPFAASTRVLFYNRKLFAEAGIDRAPRSWNELAADAEALDRAGVGTPYALPLGSEEAQAETMQWLLSGGGGYTDNVGTYRIDSEDNVRTFTWLKDELVDKGLTGPVAPAELNRADAFAAFARGEVGMLNGHPSLMKMAADEGVEYGTAAMPGRDARKHATMGVADWMMAFKQNGHEDEIGDFLDFVYSDENVLDFSREYDLLPVTASASEEMAGDKGDADLGPFLEALPSAELYPVGKTSWADVSAALKEQIGRAVRADAKPATVLGELQQTASVADREE
ncbi:extracellular solute-binding protein [Streptomyces stelliscabiei]|uniref:Multiple sugar transport system substrate-binding protein n=2 Tax=Streptomyces stelliscabiei TaxID=146820 RepID=A0A8I0TSQ4_9ACTN|nr:extracellular solute-binding protein [Streptomyces stelliscabiei]MBE1598206.1 multiple sugar transport system substrate-binding protein [Streptomyces stelliscabiei]MDX2520960.1 extracellular solute-binding protein [Streptomyces stelliscabiei]MDX2555926.1 extracellular solute-binding protein [Streptomyces stelliscabiei]MDX2616531.1 extracellular solute-binding protein [Streptomyces stelliscabiei]MDX2641195.1 extracellular solute-binding protein [Streptomyces stelliscabiei]